MPFSSYFVDFTAHIDERRRPENFPRQIHDKKLWDKIESIPHLQHLVNERFIQLVSSAGMVVLKDEDEPLIDGAITFDRRVFVPWHLITHMTVDVKLVNTPQIVQDSIVPGHIAPDPPAERVN